MTQSHTIKYIEIIIIIPRHISLPFVQLLTSYKSLLLLLSNGTTVINDVNTDTLIATINDKVNQLHKEHNQTIKEVSEMILSGH